MSDRYWCHICNKKCDILENENNIKCVDCGKEFVELIYHPDIQRIESIEFSENLPQGVAELLTTIMRSLEDRAIMNTLQQNNMERVLNESFEEDSAVEKKTSKDYIDTLNVILLNNEEIKKECAVCHENFTKELKGIKLNCRHIFHKDCILPWLEKQNTCPVCRDEMPIEE